VEADASVNKEKRRKNGRSAGGVGPSVCGSGGVSCSSSQPPGRACLLEVRNRLD